MGAGLGAVGMYLMDPDSGRNRRRHIHDYAGEAIGSASTGMHRYRDNLMRGARHLGRNLPRSASSLGAVSDIGHAIQPRANRLMKQARSYLPSMPQAAKQSTGASFSMMLAVAGAAAIGAGIMFLSDPRSGRQRRKHIGDKAHHYVREAEHGFTRLEKKARHYRNVAGGYMHRAQEGVAGMFDKARGRLTLGNNPSPRDETLATRAAREIETILSPGGEVCITAMNGSIILAGHVVAADRMLIEERIRMIDGIESVKNELELIGDPIPQSTEQL